MDISDHVTLSTNSENDTYDMNEEYLSFINKKYRSDKSLTKNTLLNELLIAQDYLTNSKVVPQELKRRHRILCSIVDIYPDELEEAINYYSIKKNEMYKFKIDINLIIKI